MSNNENETLRKGIFWIPYPDEPEKNDAYLFFIECNSFGNPTMPLTGPGIAKNGNNYNHKLLWESLSRDLTFGHPFDYYPRGRVEIKNRVARVFLHPSLNTPAIRKYLIDRYHLAVSVGICEQIFISDGSGHYQSKLQNEERQKATDPSEKKKVSLTRIAPMPAAFYERVEAAIESAEPIDTPIVIERSPLPHSNEIKGKYGNLLRWHLLDVARWTGIDPQDGILVNTFTFGYRFYRREESTQNARCSMGAWLTGRTDDAPTEQALDELVSEPLQLLSKKIPLADIKAVISSENVPHLDSDAIMSLGEKGAVLYIDYHELSKDNLGSFIAKVRNELKSNVIIYVLSIW